MDVTFIFTHNEANLGITDPASHATITRFLNLHISGGVTAVTQERRENFQKHVVGGVTRALSLVPAALATANSITCDDIKACHERTSKVFNVPRLANSVGSLLVCAQQVAKLVDMSDILEDYVVQEWFPHVSVLQDKNPYMPQMLDMLLSAAKATVPSGEVSILQAAGAFCTHTANSTTLWVPFPSLMQRKFGEHIPDDHFKASDAASILMHLDKDQLEVKSKQKRVKYFLDSGEVTSGKAYCLPINLAKLPPAHSAAIKQVSIRQFLDIIVPSLIIVGHC
jgi:hypothetical protein